VSLSDEHPDTMSINMTVSAPHNHFNAEAEGSMFLHNIFILSGVGLSPLGTAATTDLLYQPLMIHDGDCGTIGGMRIGKETEVLKRKSAPLPLCPPQIPHDLSRAQTRAATVGRQQLTA
jgi:hypothetical protein